MKSEEIFQKAEDRQKLRLPKTGEEFKQVPGFLVRASNLGRVQNERGMVLQNYLGSGYRQIKVKREDGVRVSCGVHRLVAMVWIGSIPPGHWVNHKDGNKENNRIENLEIGTPSYNHLHARDVLKRRYVRSEDAPAGKLTKEGVEAIVALKNLGWSQHKISRAFGVSQPAVSDILNGKTWKPE